jgi:hypothetical protein
MGSEGFSSASGIVEATMRLLEDERWRDTPGQGGSRRDRRAPSRSGPQE